MKRFLMVMILFMGVVSLRAQSAATETVRLGYELTLTHCKGGDCHTDPAAKGEVDVALAPGGAGLAGTQTIPLQADGVTYAVVFKASSMPPTSGVARHVDVVLTGARNSAGGSISFHAHGAASCVAWSTLPQMTIAADAYAAHGEQVTPTLHVRVIE